MVAVFSSGLLLLVTVLGATCQEVFSPENETPIADRRKFVTAGKKWKFLPAIKKPKSTGWLPSIWPFASEPEVEPPTVHELAPLGRYPIWKVHKYKGIELRPVPVLDTPRAVDLPVVRAEPPPLIQVPQYGPPVAEYGVPAVEYGAPPAVEYGVPAVEYGVPAAPLPYPPVAKDPEESSTTPAPEETVTEDAEASPESLDVLSNLGSLTSFLGDGEQTGNLAQLQMFTRLFGADKNIFSKLKSLKSWKFPTVTKAAVPVPAPTSAIYLPPKKDAKSLFSSFIPSFFRGASTEASIPLPPLPEVQEVPVPGINHVGFQVPELPPIHLPTYVSNHVSGPYVRVKIGNPPGVLPPPPPIPTAANVDFKYPIVPSPEPIYQPVYTGFASPAVPVVPTAPVAPLYNSYGVAIPYDSYTAAASEQEPLIVTPEPQTQKTPIKQQQQPLQPVQMNFQPHSFPSQQNQRQLQQLSETEQSKKTESSVKSEEASMEYDAYDAHLEDNAEMMDPRGQ